MATFGIVVWLGLWMAGSLTVLASFMREAESGPPSSTDARVARPGRCGTSRPVLGRVIAAGGGAGAIGFLMSGSPVLTATAVCGGAWLPFAIRRRGEERAARQVRDSWPDAIDALASGVRAGLSLPEALSELGRHGPEPLRPAFREFEADLRSDGDFGRASDRLKDGLADPVADRIVESIRVAREVGGTDLGRLLRTLSAALRDDARLRAEVASRQSWTVNAARLAVAAPWLTLAVLAVRPRSLAAYGSATGATVLAGAAVTCWIAYRSMLRIGRLPAETRVLH